MFVPFHWSHTAFLTLSVSLSLTLFSWSVCEMFFSMTRFVKRTRNDSFLESLKYKFWIKLSVLHLRATTHYFTAACFFRLELPLCCVSEADLTAELPLMWNAAENVL